MTTWVLGVPADHSQSVGLESTDGHDLFHVKDRIGGYVAVDLRLDAPPVTVGDRFIPLSRALAVPRSRGRAGRVKLDGSCWPSGRGESEARAPLGRGRQWGLRRRNAG